MHLSKTTEVVIRLDDLVVVEVYMGYIYHFYGQRQETKQVNSFWGTNTHGRNILSKAKY